MNAMHLHRRRLFIATLSTAWAALAARAAEPDAPPIRLGLLSSTAPVNKVGLAILTRAYALAGQPVQFVELPLRRSLQMVLDGSLDGEMFRVGALAEREPTLHRVPTPLLTIESRVYLRKDSPDARLVPEWKSFADRKVAYERGSLQIEDNLKGIATLVQANGLEEALRLLNAGSADAAVINEPKGARMHPLAAQFNFVRLEQPLDAVPFYHYLGARHGELAKRLDKVLHQMEADGSLTRLRQPAPP